MSDRKSFDCRANDEIVTLCERLDTELRKHDGKVGCAEANYMSLLKVQKEGLAPLFRPKIGITPAGKSGCVFQPAPSDGSPMTKWRTSLGEISR